MNTTNNRMPRYDDEDDPFGGFGATINNAKPLPTEAALLDDEAALPPRAWIGGAGVIPARCITLISGPPGVSKTTFALHLALALASGQPWAGIVEPEQPHRVLFAAVEDDPNEIRRRAHAATPLIADHPRLRALINNNLAIINIADILPLIEVTQDGVGIETTGFLALQATIAQHRPDIIFLDPLIELHTAEENANHAMRAVMRAFRRVCHLYETTLVLLHHETKAGIGDALQRIRGAGSIGGAIRRHWSLRTMNAEEAAEYNIAEDTRDLFIRVETGKAQYARRQPTRWLSIEEVELANGDATHRLTTWSPPSVAVTPEMLSAAQRAVRAGWNGEPLSLAPRSHAYYRHAFTHAGIPASIHTRILDKLLEDGSVTVRAWRDPEDRKLRKRLFSQGTSLTGWSDNDDEHIA